MGHYPLKIACLPIPPLLRATDLIIPQYAGFVKPFLLFSALIIKIFEILLTNTPLGYIIKIPHIGIRRFCMEQNKCCCEKSTVRTEEDKKKLMNRLKRIEGQIRGIQTMLENDAYCNDILIQSAAANAAINAFNKEILSRHIHTCVVRDIKDGKLDVVDELTATVQKLMK